MDKTAILKELVLLELNAQDQMDRVQRLMQAIQPLPDKDFEQMELPDGETETGD